MHEPLPRELRTRYRPDSALALIGACAAVVVLAIAVTGIALVVGELTVGRSDQAVATAKLTTGSVTGARDAAPSPNDLFSGMPLP